jgi:hypothetical protein
MPAVRLGTEPVRIELFDIVGMDSDSVAGFVRHVALSAIERSTHSRTDTLSVTDMQPPLTIEEDAEAIDVHASLPLTNDERQQVNLFIDELRREYESQAIGGRAQYTIHPVCRPEHANDGTIRYYRYSCAGFVLAAYGSLSGAGITLLTEDENQLPPVALEVICTAYPDYAGQLRDLRWRTRYNLPGDGPWPIILPGYIFHALNRDEAIIRSDPYCPQSGDECFPTVR